MGLLHFRNVPWLLSSFFLRLIFLENNCVIVSLVFVLYKITSITLLGQKDQNLAEEIFKCISLKTYYILLDISLNFVLPTVIGIKSTLAEMSEDSKPLLWTSADSVLRLHNMTRMWAWIKELLTLEETNSIVYSLYWPGVGVTRGPFFTLSAMEIFD